ncbi:MAG: hypothetical protein ABEK00_00280 [Candidatus Nanohaloarchaea archaeon]
MRDKARGRADPHLPTEYQEKLDSSANMMSSGLAAVATYLRGGGRRNIREAYEIGSLIGLNTRIVDDFLDGDGVPEAEDREELLNTYIQSIQDEEVPQQVQGPERALYEIGAATGEELEKEFYLPYVKDARDILLEEDKESVEGYKAYSRGVSGMIGEMVGTSLGTLEDFEPETDDLQFSYDLAYLGQVADDVMDDDLDLDELERFYKESVERIKRHGLTGKLSGDLASIYPRIYRGMKSLQK